MLDTSPAAPQEEEMIARRTAEAIARPLKEVTENWDIKEKVVSFVHYNGSEVKNVGAAIGVEDISCAGHTLQLCVNDSFKSHPALVRLVANRRHLVGHFKKSVAATKS